MSCLSRLNQIDCKRERWRERKSKRESERERVREIERHTDRQIETRGKGLSVGESRRHFNNKPAKKVSGDVYKTQNKK